MVVKMVRKEKIKLSKNIKQKLFLGFLCIFIGLFFGLLYDFILYLDTIWGIGAITLGFSSGNFIIIMGIIEDIYGSKRK